MVSQASGTGPGAWTVALCVKSLATAKTRMAQRVDPASRAKLVLAMTKDVLAAVTACRGVARCIVVTADPTVAAVAEQAGAHPLREAADDGLNTALARAIAFTSATYGGPLALLMADLPFLSSEALRGLLARISPGRPAVVADLDGTGTTLLAASAAELLRPRFGLASRQHHVQEGAVDLSSECDSSLRHDVDTLDALLSRDGLGPSTTGWLSDYLP